MANDCLVTKLKRSVDNPNLPIFDGMTIVLSRGQLFSGSMAQSGDSAKIILTKGNATGATFPVTISNAANGENYNITASENDTVITVTNCHTLKIINPILTTVRMSITEMQNKFPSLSCFAGSSKQNQPFKLYGDLSELKTSNHLVYVQKFLPDIYGDIKYLGRLISLIEFLERSGVYTGDLTDIVKIARGYNRTTGNILIWINKDTQVKFNGETLPNYKDGKGGTLSWTATTITLGETTIENSDVIAE